MPLSIALIASALEGIDLHWFYMSRVGGWILWSKLGNWLIIPAVPEIKLFVRFCSSTAILIACATDVGASRSTFLAILAVLQPVYKYI